MNFSEIMKMARNFILIGEKEDVLPLSEVENNLLGLAGIIMGIAVCVLLVVGPIMGVKYMISGADEKANLKQKLVWYVIAAVLIFGAVGIYNIVVRIMMSIV